MNSNFDAAVWHTSVYYPYQSQPSQPYTFTWKFYADAQCQMFPAIYGVDDCNNLRSNNLWDQFNSHFPNWSTGTLFDSGDAWHTLVPSSIIGVAAAKMNDVERCTHYLDYVNGFGAGQEPPYWNCSEAGSLLITANYIKKHATNLAFGKTATASPGGGGLPSYVNDGLRSTRWSSDTANGQWWQVDLTGNATTVSISKVVIFWEDAYDSAYKIQTSTNGSSWSDITSTITTNGNGGRDELSFTAVNTRYVRVVCTTRATPYGSSFWEVEVYQ